MLLVEEKSSAARRPSPHWVNGRRLLYRRRMLDYETRKWSKTWNNYVLVLEEGETEEDIESEESSSFAVDLSMGGRVVIHPNYITKQKQELLKDEMLKGIKPRVYPIQNRLEPRLHCLYHEHATNKLVETTDSDGNVIVLDGVEDPHQAQPSYSYGRAIMKARPLKDVPEIQNLYQQLAQTCLDNNDLEGVETIENLFNIGVDVLFYRDGHDKIGYHADDDQDEELICTAVVDCPAGPRMVRIQPNKKIQKLIKDGLYHEPVDQVDIFVAGRDAYTMDGEMQKNYGHGVPVDKKHVGEGCRHRLALVFRRGRAETRNVDSGVAFDDLSPIEKKVPYEFGPLLVPDGNGGFRLVLEYNKVYRRDFLLHEQAHSGVQRGISGKKGFGCDAIIISSERPDGLAVDKIQAFMYEATSKVGALGMVETYNNKQCVRVFRTSDHDASIRRFPRKVKGYRYDGLAEIVSYEAPKEKGGLFKFYLVMLNWNPKTRRNDDPLTKEDYDAMRLLRRTPPDDEILEPNDVQRLYKEVSASPQRLSHRLEESGEPDKEDEDDLLSDAGDEEIVDKESGSVPIQQEPVRVAPAPVARRRKGAETTRRGKKTKRKASATISQVMGQSEPTARPPLNADGINLVNLYTFHRHDPDYQQMLEEKRLKASIRTRAHLMRAAKNKNRKHFT